MPHQHRRGRPLGWTYEVPAEDIQADPFASAREICAMLPAALGAAEAAGLSIIGQYLAKSLHLAQGIVASGEAQGRDVSAGARRGTP